MDPGKNHFSPVVTNLRPSLKDKNKSSDWVRSRPRSFEDYAKIRVGSRWGNGQRGFDFAQHDNL